MQTGFSYYPFCKESYLSQVIFYSQRPRKLQRKRIFFFACLVLLNISGPLSLVTRLIHHDLVNWGAEMFHLGCVILINIYMLPSVLFEVDSIEVTESGLKVKNLLWTSQATFSEVKSFDVRQFFIWAILKTQSCFYLINRRDLPNFDELVSILSARLPCRQE